MQAEVTEHELMETVFPHPTLSEMMHEALLDAYNHRASRAVSSPIEGEQGAYGKVLHA